MNNKNINTILKHVSTILRELHCKLTCCCKSSCNDPTEINYIDDFNKKQKYLVID